MAGHVIRSGLFMILGLAPLVFVRWRFDVGRVTLRRFLIAYVVILGVIAVISAGSVTYETRCPSNPLEFCRYNDSVPFMGVLAFVFVVSGGIRSWMLYVDR